jgi:putative aldouronate transport system permease protein
MVKTKIEWNYGEHGIGSRIFDFFNISLMIFMIFITIYPFLYVFFASISEPARFMSHQGVLWKPLGFQLRVYEMVLNNAAIKNGYLVTFFVVIVGTLCNMTASLLFAYVLSRRNLMFHGIITFLAVFTMYFSGGMIPVYLVVKGVGLLDSLWSLIIPGLINTYNVIIIRTAFKGIPLEMEESARMDGAGNLNILTHILIPLIVPTIAAISLFYMVGHWNAWTNALIYIRTTAKYPLQLVLRAILLQNSVNTTASMGTGSSVLSGTITLEDIALTEIMKYSTIVISIVPIICVYPFLQRYFTKGIMIGAVKG